MQNPLLETQVIIVGAGPTGLSLAVQLMRYGIDFVIIDQKAGVTELSKAMVVHARTLEIYDQVGLAERAIAGGEIFEKAALMHNGQITAHLDLSDFGQQLSPFPFGLIFEQSKNEHLLYEHLQHHGKEVRWQTELETITQDAESVRAVLKTENGEEQTIQACYLVGCDGASSPTRHFLGLTFAGSTHPRLFYVADVSMEFQADESTFYGAFGRDSFVLLFSMQGDKQWRLIGNLPEYDDQVDREVTYDEIEHKTKQLVQRPLEITDVHWFSSYKVHTRHAERFSVGRCFLAGDAAHIHTPAGGQGMNTGIQDAYNLAWKIALVLRGDTGDSLLESYNEERLANAKRLLHTTDQVFEVMASDQWYVQFFRNNILPTLARLVVNFGVAKEFLFPIVSQIGINYRDSSLSQHHDDRHFQVKAGDRMPYFLVTDANVYDKLREPKFHLIVFSNEEVNHEGLRAKLEYKYDNLIGFHVISLYPRVVEIFGTDQPFLVLLRPDHYIGLISAQVSLDDLKAYFNQVIKLQNQPVDR